MNLKIKNITKSPFYDGLFFRFWLFGVLVFLFFQFIRIGTLFLIGWNFNWNDFLKIIQGGIKMDISTTSYLLGYFGSLIGLIRITIVNNAKRLLKLILVINTAIIIILLLVLIADVFLLKYWGSRVNSQALSYLKYPEQAMKASLSEGIFISAVIGIVLLVLGIYIWTLKIADQLKKILKQRKFSIKSLAYSLISICLLILGARGGWSKVPLQISEAFEFQNENNLNNQLSLNSIWNFIHQVMNEDQLPEVEHITQLNWSNYRDPFNEDSQVNIPQKGKINIPIQMGNDSKPNIYLFILEGVSAEVSAYFSHSKLNATPKLDELAQKGWGFKQAFACGDRTDKGLATILTGWPGQPWQSILNYPDKYRNLPTIAKSFNSQGYQTNFYYGGNSRFANMHDFLMSAGVKEIVDESVIDQFDLNFLRNKGSISLNTWTYYHKFSSVNSAESGKNNKLEFDNQVNKSRLKGNWGYFDPVLFDVLCKFAPKLNRNKKPGFNIILTSSTHEPYDINPIFKNKIDYKTELEKYIQSVKILDESLYQCIKKIESSDKNAVFIIVSDHGKYLNDANTMFGQRNFFHIPLIFYGNSINKLQSNISSFALGDVKARITEKVVSQTDIVRSLEFLIFKNRIGQNQQSFIYSRNVFNTQHPNNAWFNMYGVMGMIEPNETNWLSTDKKALENEIPWNSKDSAILHRGRKIILDFFSL